MGRGLPVFRDPGVTRFRPRSLFWTFAGAFLFVLLLATVLQGLVVVAVVGPLASRWVDDRARLLARETASALAAFDPTDDEAIHRVLDERRRESAGVMLLVRDPDSMLIGDRRLRFLDPARLQKLTGAVSIRPPARPEGPRPFFPDERSGRPDEPDRNGGGSPGAGGGNLGHRGDDAPPAGPDRPGSPSGLESPGRESGRGFPGPPGEPFPPGKTSPSGKAGPSGEPFPPGGPFPPRFGGDPGPEPGERARPGGLGNERLRVAARQPIHYDNGASAEVLALVPRPRFGFWPGGPLPLLLFAPLAVILAGGAGLVMARSTVRRLRALETQAARVSRGELDARVADTGADEIGRVGERMNAMTSALGAARTEVEESVRQRRRLLADISHELGTPLTSIGGYAQTLLDPDVHVSDAERAAFLRDILDESVRMDALIQDLFELTRIEGGRAELHRERLDWASLARNTVERFRKRFGEAGLNLRWDSAGIEAWVEADGRRLEQALDNLLVNALRYVPAGGTVSVSLTRLEGDPGPRLRLTVADDGPGIPPGDLPHVFNRFYRADPARGTPGTGLGLAIAQEIVLRHGGSVRAANREPRGLAIHLELPA